MPALVTVRGPNAGHRFPLDESCCIIGRQPDAEVYLESLAVSRHHARVLNQPDGIFVEDLKSSNGTFINGHRIAGPVALTARDVLQIGPYEFSLFIEPPPTEPPQVIRAKIEAQASNYTLFAQNPAMKLERMLQIAQDLGRNLDIDPLLGRLLEHLMGLFPQADRGMVLLCDKDRPVVRAQRVRHGDPRGDYAYSRTIVQKALEEGVGLLSEDVQGDRNIVLSATMVSLNLRSFLCVPMLGWEGRRLGVIQLDCLRPGMVFRAADLELLTAIGLQSAVVLQNAIYHVERIREERLRQEVLMARDIQSQFLPATFSVAGPEAELFAKCLPAREVSGDLYDFFSLPDGRLAFFVGDVSGKGMSAALFMIAVRTLARYFGPSVTGAADFLHRLNNALAHDNPTHLYVTMVFGIYDSKDGSLTLARGGHPAPILRRADGQAAPLDVKPGLMLGSTELPRPGPEAKLTLGPGETVVLYTDGYHEATAQDGTTQFGVPRVCEAVGAGADGLTLEQMADRAAAAVQAFAPGEQQDDMTLLLLRRCQGGGAAMNQSDDTLVIKNTLVPDMPKPYSSLVAVELAAMSHVGKVRKNNEDSYLAFKTGRSWERLLTSLPEGDLPERFDEVGYVMAVADGMGGTSGGEVASALALRAAVAAILNAPNWSLKLDHPDLRGEAVEKAIERGLGYFKAAHDAILKLAQAGGPGVDRMGTTLTATYSFGSDLFILHVGDSRAYLFREGRLQRLTRDHTMAQDLVDAGALSEAEASGHRFSHVLTRALSAQTEDVTTEVGAVELHDGDLVLLCSDGLTGMVPDETIARILSRGGTAARACQELIDAALLGGGRDNVTAVIGRYSLPPS